MTDSSDRPSGVRDVEYKGAPLDAEKGPGLGCFWIQVVALVSLLVLTPLSVAWNWPTFVSAILLVAVLVLLLVAGQTVIFLLRLVAADRRDGSRRRPLGAATPTVGELEDREAAPAPDDGHPPTRAMDPPDEPAMDPPDEPAMDPPEEPAMDGPAEHGDQPPAEHGHQRPAEHGDQRPDGPGVRE